MRIMKQIDPFGKLMVTIGLSFVHMIIFSVLGYSISSAFFDVDISDLMNLQKLLDQESVINSAVVIQMLTTIGMFLMAGYVAAKLFSHNPNQYLRWNVIASPKWLLLTIVLMLIALPVINFLGAVNMAIPFPESMEGIKESLEASEESNEELIMAFLSREGIGYLLVNLMMVAVLPAIGEEVLFRGVLQKVSIELFKNGHIGIWVTGFVFSAIHGSYFGFLPRFFMGVLFGYLFVWSRSLWVPILAHFVNNAFAVLLAYFVGFEALEDKMAENGPAQDYTMVFGAFVVLIGILYLLYQWRDQSWATKNHEISNE